MGVPAFSLGPGNLYGPLAASESGDLARFKQGFKLTAGHPTVVAADDYSAVLHGGIVVVLSCLDRDAVIEPRLFTLNINRQGPGPLNWVPREQAHRWKGPVPEWPGQFV